MTAGASQESIEGALEAAFTDAPVEKAPVAAPEPEVPEVEAEEVAAEEAEPQEEEQQEEAPAVAEPEFEIEVSGQRHVVKGAEQVKELLQKGMDYSQKTEFVARAQEALSARAQMLQMQEQFQNLISEDLAELKSIDRALDTYNKIDWAQQFDTDPFNAMKLREQRDQLREQRNAKYAELNQKHESYRAGQAQAAQQALASEHAALLAKLPEWRNSDVAAKEKTEIATYLKNSGFQPAELSTLSDHRALIIARKAYLYDKLQAGKSDKVKQVREAPPVVKPGVTPKPNPKAEFTKVKSHLRKLGTQGNHKGQEALVTEMLTRTFK